MKPIAWIGIGCGAIVVVVLIAMVGGGVFLFNKGSDFVEDLSENPAAATAEAFVRLNPAIEIVESDREAGKITVREKATGKVTTFDYEDIEEGRFSFETDGGESVRFDARAEDGTMSVETNEGTTTFGTAGAIELPSWLPPYGNISGDVGGFVSVGDETSSGTVGFQTTDDLETIMAFYEEVLEGLGVEINRGSFSSGDTNSMSVGGSSTDHTLQVSGQTTSGTTSVNLTFSGPR